MQRPSFVGGLAAVIFAGVTGACGNHREREAGAASNPLAPGSGAQPVVVSLEISGPESIPPGQSARFTALARLDDGTRQPAAGVRWSSSSRFLRVDASGLVVAGEQPGEDVLAAEVTTGAGRGVRSTRQILVLPDGTYRMVGLVTESGESTPIVGARVEVTGNAPTVAITDWDGGYRLYGVPDTAEIRVTRDGYLPHVQRVQIGGHVTQHFQLALSAARLDLAGTYTLTIDAACATSTPVPEEVRHRSYAASVTQSGSRLDVVLTETSRFLVRAGRGDRFSGRADAVGATFTLEGFTEGYYFFPPPADGSDYANLVERFSNGNVLLVTGAVLARGSGAGLSGELRGFFSHHDVSFLSVPLLSSAMGTCYATAHRFALTPR